MHTSISKLVWVFLVCIQVKLQHFYYKERVFIDLAQGFFIWSLHIWVFWWLHKGFVSIFIINIHLCLHKHCKPFSTFFLNSKVKWMMQVWGWSLWYASLVDHYVMQVGLIIMYDTCCYVMQVWVDHYTHVIMLCKLNLSLWA